jgi:hypothetical protein
MTKLMKLAATAILVAGCHSEGLPQGASPDGNSQPQPIDMAAPLHCGRTTPPPAGDAFALVKYGMVATWRGTATTPWTAPYEVELTFAADGTYDARTTDGSGQLPFYYDKDPEHDRYELTDLQANGKAAGNLYLEWLATPDAIKQIALDATQTHLTFEYYHFDKGPVAYALACTP